MRISILGPLEANIGTHSIVPSATKPRKVLALLLANANRIVPISKLKYEIWDDNPPASASTTLQTYVLQLRKLLASGYEQSAEQAKETLVTRPGGYLFRVTGDELDVERYEDLARLGHADLAAGDVPGAVLRLREALGLWRGPALADVELGQLLASYVTRLKECRLHTVERCVEAELQLGRHQALLSELAVLVMEAPFNENLRAYFMLALYRSGRRSEALEAFRQLRAVLIDEIGLEPSPRMYRLHQAMLTSDPSLEHAAAPLRVAA